MLREISLALVLAISGCSAPQKSEPVATPSPSREVIVPPPASAEPTPTPPPPDEAPAATAPPSAACPDQQATQGGRPSSYCSVCRTDKSELLLQIVPADALSFPGDATTLTASKPATSPKALEYTIAATQDSLIAQVFTCPGCRRKMGWGMSITFDKLRALAEPDRRALQKSLGYAESPLLGTHTEWKSAKPLTPPTRTPSLPSCEH